SRALRYPRVYPGPTRPAIRFATRRPVDVAPVLAYIERVPPHPEENPMQDRQRSRRDFLKYAASACGALPLAARGGDPGPGRVEPKSVAAVMTVYRPGSHADVLVGKILAGWKQDGGPGPALKLASMYVDQFPRRDLARTLAARYRVPLFDSIPGALTLGGKA